MTTEQIKISLQKKLEFEIVDIEKVTQGVSTDVYRINLKTQNFYLRIQPEKEFSYSPVVLAHKEALSRGIKVPRVILSEDFSSEFEGSPWMLIESLDGAQTNPELTSNEIFFDAGVDVAKFNQIECDGFGWIKRDKGSIKDKFEGSFVSLYSSLTDKLEERLDEYSKRGMLNQDQKNQIVKFSELLHRIEPEKSTLAHSDISYEHVFHMDNKYSGIIDFDDLRGTNQFLDLAEVSISIKKEHYDSFLDGYRSINNLTDEQLDLDFRITRLFWFIEKGYWVIDSNPDPEKNRYWKTFMDDLEYLNNN